MQERIKTSQSKQKSYVDRRRRLLEFTVGGHVFLRVTSTTSVGRVIRSRKIYPKFIGSYKIFRRIGPVAYEIVMSPKLVNLNSVFHISQLRKYMSDLSHVLEVKDVHVREDFLMEV